MALSASQWIELLFDEGSFDQAFAGLVTPDPLHFSDSRPYPERIEEARQKSGGDEAVVTGSGASVGVRTRAGDLIEADALVLATGAYSLELTRSLGCPLPIQPGKGYHRDLEIADGSAPALNAACVLEETSVFCTPMSGVLRLAGTMEFSGLNHRLRQPRLEQLTTAAGRYMHGIGTTRVVSEWCGLRPCTPDGLPIIGRVPDHERVFVATGHAMSGLTLSPVTGSLIADLVLDEAPTIDIGQLGVERFVS